MSNHRSFRYMREDFGELPAALTHLTIYLNFSGDFVEATVCIEMKAMKRLEVLELDANSLNIVSVEWCGGPSEKGMQIAYEYRTEVNKLVVRLPRSVENGETFFIRTVTRCYPSDHLLEGIYRDSTPAGAPQQYMSQCQQWGFQRIMPIIDDCRAKCTMTTTIEADAAYTHLISNGNISRTTNPDGKAVSKPGDPSRQIITYENRVPMAPYLFLACAGTWDTLADEVTFPSGRKIRLEYLVPPGASHDARIPMEILKKAVLWIESTQGYEYTRDTYRTICMTKSNFGGMENVGNTTILTETALITKHTLDMTLLNAHEIIVHEFEHNQCGSETTMETPFDVWLNEAFTVDVARQFMATCFEPAFVRLLQVMTIRNPLVGPLSIEDAGHDGRIVREGFNNPFQLIDGVTYYKAAEIVRMLRLVMGPEDFHAGKTLYFSRYHNNNANTDQFFACFEEVSGRRLDQFKKEWLYRRGYPTVTAETNYDPENKVFRIKFRQHIQEGEAPFHIPIELALVDDAGHDVKDTATVFQLTEQEDELVLDGLSAPPAFASINRDYSFYGMFRYTEDDKDQLRRQALLDPNAYNRVDAFRRLTDIERIKLIHDPCADIDNRWLSLVGDIIENTTLPSAVKGFLLAIEEQPMAREYITWYQELVLARERLMRALNDRYRSALLSHFHALCTYTAQTPSPSAGIEDRIAKQAMLDLLAIADTAESHRIILDHLYKAATASDRVVALLALNRTSCPSRRQILENTYREWHGDFNGYPNYLHIVSSGTQPDVFKMIDEEMRRPSFDVTHPALSHALLFPITANNKMIWQDEGMAWLTTTIIASSRINEMTACRLLATYQHVSAMKPALQSKVRSALQEIMNNIKESDSPALYRQAQTYRGTDNLNPAP